MDKEQEMVVVNMDVGNQNTAGKFIRIVPRNSPFDVENNETKTFNPPCILQRNSTCMAYRKKLQ
jgi:hypothetical protein